MGANSFFTYGFVSNVNSALTLAAAWATFARTTGTSGFVPANRKAFLLVYAGIYATVGTAMRPFRFALAVALTPSFEACIQWLQPRQAMLPFKATRPRVNRSLAFVAIALLGNVAFSAALAFLAIGLSSVLTGVPVLTS